MKEAGSPTIQELTPAIKALLCDAASKLTAHRRRAFMASVTVELCGGSARRARSHFGWNRNTVESGLHERASGLVCVDNFAARGNKKMEAKRPDLERDIRALADPQFKSALSYTRLSAVSVRRALLEEKGWREEDLPAERTMNTLLNRRSYRLRSVAKTKPEKKTEATEAIFANVRSVNAAADADPACLRLSTAPRNRGVEISTPFNFNPCFTVRCTKRGHQGECPLGDYSREGKARGLEAVRALDHDLATKAKLVPVGILEVASAALDLTLGSSAKTSDLLADSLEGWWQRRGPALAHVKELVINADNGPESNGKRSQFLARPVAFADHGGLRIRLVYYPPYHKQVQSHRALLGGAGATLERHAAFHGGDGLSLGTNHDLEGPRSGGASHLGGRLGHDGDEGWPVRKLEVEEAGTLLSVARAGMPYAPTVLPL